ncbi:MAG TPA: tetratricopeptide repeat protein [Candidatus Acidoferrales bacterium]|nr:tetratricopeptide repeat protein [Candidatus Acidoferrales bacterium]
MTQSAATTAREAAYLDVERFLEAPRDLLTPRHQRACFLSVLGRRDEAQAAFMELLAEDPTNFGVLNDFGMFLFSGGMRKPALTALLEAVRWHPGDAVGLTNLASLYLTEGDFAQARAHFEKALAIDEASPKAHEGLSLALERLGELDGARAHRPTVVRAPSGIRPFAHAGDPVKVLLVESVIGGNIFAHDLLRSTAFDVRQVFIEYLQPNVPLPEHDIVWNAIGDAERCAALLDAAPSVFARSDRPVLNRPEKVRLTGRADNARRLASLEDVVTPRAHSISRARLAASGADIMRELGLSFPILLRSPGFHTGEYFVRVDAEADLAAAVAGLPGRDLLLIEFLDVRNDDGKVRKYRVVIVDGKLYPLHAAVAQQWKVHYFTADMADNAAHRDEDAAYLADFEKSIGARAVRALERVRETLGLDYGGIDFGIDPAGRVVVFEANATMIVPEPEEDERWRYRLPPVQRIYDAVRTMLVRKVETNAAP